MNDEEGKNLFLILELATKDIWMLIDCQKILGLARNKKVKLHSDLSFLLFRYNYIVLAPLKTKVKQTINNSIIPVKAYQKRVV